MHGKLSSASLQLLVHSVSHRVPSHDDCRGRSVLNACGIVQFAAIHSPLLVMYGTSVQRHARSVGSHCEVGTVAATHVVCEDRQLFQGHHTVIFDDVQYQMLTAHEGNSASSAKSSATSVALEPTGDCFAVQRAPNRAEEMIEARMMKLVWLCPSQSFDGRYR